MRRDSWGFEFYAIVEIIQLAFTHLKLYFCCQYRQLWPLPATKAFIDSDLVCRNEDGTMYFDWVLGWFWFSTTHPFVLSSIIIDFVELSTAVNAAYTLNRSEVLTVTRNKQILPVHFQHALQFSEDHQPGATLLLVRFRSPQLKAIHEYFQAEIERWRRADQSLLRLVCIVPWCLDLGLIP